MPQSPRGWLQWAADVLERQARPFTVRPDRGPRTDPRLWDARETALSVKIMLERSSNSDRGRGARLLVAYWLDEMSWRSFSPREKRVIAKTARRFRCALCAGDFLEPCDRPQRRCVRGSE